MRSQILLILSAWLVLVWADCSHNNCLRAVIASAYPTRPTVADCGSFLAITTTPSTVYVSFPINA